MKLEFFLGKMSNWSTQSTAWVTNSSLRAWFISSVLWVKGEGIVFLGNSYDEKMDGNSLSIIFVFRNCIKALTDSNWNWMNVCIASNAPDSAWWWSNDGWENDWFENACLTLNSLSNFKCRTCRITFLGLKFDLRYLTILKLLWGIIYLTFVSLFHLRPMFPFLYRSMEV